jgi:hypothetical protein
VYVCVCVCISRLCTVEEKSLLFTDLRRQTAWTDNGRRYCGCVSCGVYVGGGRLGTVLLHETHEFSVEFLGGQKFFFNYSK